MYYTRGTALNEHRNPKMYGLETPLMDLVQTFDEENILNSSLTNQSIGIY